MTYSITCNGKTIHRHIPTREEAHKILDSMHANLMNENKCTERDRQGCHVIVNGGEYVYMIGE